MSSPPAHARTPSPRSQHALRLAIVAASAVGAALADTAPTGRPWVDVVWRALLAALVTAAGLTAGPLARVAPALVALAVFAATGSWLGAGIALALLIASSYAPVRPPWGPPASAALVAAGVQLLFRLPALSPDGMTVVLAVLASVSVLRSGWTGLDRPARQGVRRASWIAAAVGAVAIAPFLVAAVLARSEIGEGTGEAEAWRVATTEGEPEAAQDHLDAAAAAFGRAQDQLDGWWAAPAGLVPFVSQHAEAADVGVRSGRRLVASAQSVSAVVDPKDLRLTDGALDLDLVASVRGPLRTGQATLSDVEDDLAGIDTRWLLPFVADDVDSVEQQVRDARTDADLAGRVLDVVPGLLGESEPKRYFVVFSSPAETRELGGFMGNWGILTATDGQLELEQTGRSKDLNLLGTDRGIALTDPASFPIRYVRSQPETFWQNVTSSPDLPTVARGIADLYQQATDDAIDGVLVLDPTALSALLELTGPVTVEGLDEPLTSDNAADFLLREQYLQFPELGERVDFLADAADATFDQLISGVQPSPTEITDAMAPVVRSRHLLFWAFDPSAQPLLAELGLDGTLPPDDDRDVLVVARSNMLANKMDAYLTEDLHYDVEVDPSTGAVSATLTATYTNAAPPGLPAYVASNNDGIPDRTARILVSVWTPHQASGATIDGVAAPLEAQVELARNRYLTPVTIAPGATVTLVVRLDGALAAEHYRLTVVRQPLTEPSALEVEVHDPSGDPLPGATRVVVVGG